jgi:hypothetical protein
LGKDSFRFPQGDFAEGEGSVEKTFRISNCEFRIEKSISDLEFRIANLKEQFDLKIG